MKGMVKPEFYRRDIDGLRAIAVASVVLFHADLGCPGGYVGVDIFFVISGYLITQIIQRDLNRGGFSILKFYQRRIRRIFPAFFAMVLVLMVVGWRFLPPDELVDLGKCIVAASGFCSNILFFGRAGYFDRSSLTMPLLHTWTLSVEEQFYVFWPWILLALHWKWIAKWKSWAVALLLCASLVLSAYWVANRPEAAFYMLPSRAWELGLGCFLAISPFTGMLARMPRLVADSLSVAGILLIGYSVFLFNSLVPFPGFAALVPCAGAGLVLASGEGRVTAGGRLLGLGPLVWTGLISYSLYLWHWPILVFARVFANGELSRVEDLACVALATLVSWASWRFVESPFRNPVVVGGQSRTWVWGGLATTAVFVLAGFLFYRGHGFPSRGGEVESWVAAEQSEANRQLINSPCLVWKAALPPVDTCLLGTAGEKPAYRMVLWGDSNAAHLAPAFRELGMNSKIGIREMTKAGCAPLPEVKVVPVTAMTIDCPAFNARAMAAMLNDPQVTTVVLAAEWIHFADGTAAAPLGRSYQDRQASRQLFVRALHQTLQELADNGKRVIIVGQVPIPRTNPITCIARARFNHWSEDPCLTMPAGPAQHDETEVNEVLSAATQGLLMVKIVHPFDALCDQRACSLVYGGVPLYWDLAHLSDSGAKRVLPPIEDGLGGASVSDPMDGKQALPGGHLRG